MLCLGLGLWSKITFGIFLLALFVSVIVFYRKSIKIKSKSIFIALLMFTLGVLPLLYMNIAGKTCAINQSGITNTQVCVRGTTLRLLYNTIFKGASLFPETNNHAFIHNLLLRVSQFENVYGKANIETYEPLFSYSVYKYSFFSGYIFLFALAYLIGDMILRSNHIRNRRTAFVLMMFTIMFLGLCFTPTQFRLYQLIFLMPFPQLILALFLYRAYVNLRDTISSRLIACGVSGLIILPFLYTNATILRERESDSFVPNRLESTLVIYSLNDYLLTKGIHDVVVVDPHAETYYKLYFISGDRLNMASFYNYNKNDYGGDAIRFKKYLSERKVGANIYLLKCAQNNSENDDLEKKYFNELIEKYNFKATDLREFKDMAGRTAYTLYMLRRKK
jgi:hypothetical protein